MYFNVYNDETCKKSTFGLKRIEEKKFVEQKTK